MGPDMPLSTISRLTISCLTIPRLAITVICVMVSTTASAHHTTSVPLIVAATVVTAASGTHAKEHGAIVVTAAFARASAGPARNGAAYLTVENKSGHPDRLIGARTDVAAKAELHTHLHEGGVMKMRPVEAIDLPAHGSATLKPGGDHVMLMGLAAPLKEGESFPLTLIFEKAGEVEVTVTIGGVGAMHAPTGQDGHGTHGGHKN